MQHYIAAGIGPAPDLMQRPGQECNPPLKMGGPVLRGSSRIGVAFVPAHCGDFRPGWEFTNALQTGGPVLQGSSRIDIAFVPAHRGDFCSGWEFTNALQMGGPVLRGSSRIDVAFILLQPGIYKCTRNGRASAARFVKDRHFFRTGPWS